MIEGIREAQASLSRNGEDVLRILKENKIKAALLVAGGMGVISQLVQGTPEVSARPLADNAYACSPNENLRGDIQFDGYFPLSKAGTIMQFLDRGEVVTVMSQRVGVMGNEYRNSNPSETQLFTIVAKDPGMVQIQTFDGVFTGMKRFRIDPSRALDYQSLVDDGVEIGRVERARSLIGGNCNNPTNGCWAADMRSALAVSDGNGGFNYQLFTETKCVGR